MSMKITQAHIDIFKDVFNISSEEKENGVIEKDQDKDLKATQEAEDKLSGFVAWIMHLVFRASNYYKKH